MTVPNANTSDARVKQHGGHDSSSGALHGNTAALASEELSSSEEEEEEEDEEEEERPRIFREMPKSPSLTINCGDSEGDCTSECAKSSAAWSRGSERNTFSLRRSLWSTGGSKLCR